eukprot:scaffold7092_cov262-Pinguiococcus_pyrenoidosus.AAC.15
MAAKDFARVVRAKLLQREARVRRRRHRARRQIGAVSTRRAAERRPGRHRPELATSAATWRRRLGPASTET